MNNKDGAVKETLILMLKLGIICIIVAGLLAAVNGITLPIIEKNDEVNFNKSMAEVLDGESYEELNIEYTPDDTGVEVKSVYAAKNADDINGYVVTTVCKEGYGGDIQVMVGVAFDEQSDSLSVKNVKIMSMSETAGLGAKASEDDFITQYGGLKSGIGVEKNKGGNPQNNTISAISGATVTSKAVTKAVNCGLMAAEEAMKGGEV